MNNDYKIKINKIATPPIGFYSDASGGARDKTRYLAPLYVKDHEFVLIILLIIVL